MKFKILYIFLIVIFAFGAGASHSTKRRTQRQANRITHIKLQKKPVKAARCNPIALVKTNELERALKCAVKIKNRHLIKTIKWLYYSKRTNNASFNDIVRFVKNNPKFPDKSKLLRIAERKINNKTSTRALKRWCSRNLPETGNGAKYCLVALAKIKTKNKVIKARIIKLIKIVWAREFFPPKEERLFIKKYRRVLKRQDHINRLNYILLNKKKLSPVVLARLDKEHRELFRVKLQLATKYKHLNSRKNHNIFKKISAHLRKEPYLLYLRARWYAARKDDKHLTSLLIRYSKVSETKTDRWFKIRSVLVWHLMDKGKYKTAYKIAAAHKYKDSSNYVDGEWLAGKVAYFNLRNPKLAYKHFENIFTHSKYSLSRAKGAYWSGVAMKSLRKVKLAQKHFKTASKYIDTFYGQLALMQLYNNKIGYYSLPAVPRVTKQDVRWFRNNELLIISHVLSRMHKDYSARKFVRAALNVANTKGKKYLVAKFGGRVGIDSLLTISGKEAARRGALFIEHAYPVLRLKKEKIPIEKALVHSIIRQESEFNPRAKSSAGATGLMQLMYPTARQIGRKMKQNVTSNSLKNPKINISLGTQHLSELIKKYQGSYVLAIAAYNAGAGNVNKWINKRGDPRKLKRMNKVVAWIENIPFSETRGYVQYVLSNLQIYRNILLGNRKTKLKKLRVDLGQDLLS